MAPIRPWSLPKESVQRSLAETKDAIFRVGHAAELVRYLGQEIGQLGAKRSSTDWDQLGLRVEYLADLLLSHVSELDVGIKRAEFFQDKLAEYAEQ